MPAVAAMLVAALSVEMALLPILRTPSAWAQEAVQLCASLVVGLAAAQSSNRFGRYLTRALLMLLAAGPFIAWCTLGAMGRGGPPLEMTLLSGCRNLMITMALAGGTGLRPRFADASGLFLLLFSVTITGGRLSMLLMAAYAVCGCAWLMDSSRRSVPRGAILLIPILFGILTAAASLLPERALAAVNGWIPSSGGVRSASPDATSGIGDGPDEIPDGNNPKSTGFDQGRLFVNSDRASLYDSFVEAFGEPVKSTDFQKLQFLKRDEIALSANVAVEDFRAGKCFPLLREPPPGRPSDSSRAAEALLYVQGRTPLYLPLYVYDHFDGRIWQQSTASRMRRQIEATNGNPLVKLLMDRPSPFLAGGETHQIRMGRFASDRLTLPGHTTEFRLGRVARAELFAWAQPDIMHLTGRSVPTGAVLQTVSEVEDRAALFSADFGGERETSDADPRVAQLARQWTAGARRGWEQVQAITAHLRRDYVLDRSAVATSENDAVADFLFRVHRGPDDLFATSAALMLRSLGYPLRVVSGFYVSEIAFDAAAGQTPLCSADLHIWAELQMPDETWVTVEPTPGYEVPSATRAASMPALRAAGQWCRSHCGILWAHLGAIAVIVPLRRRLDDGLRTSAWRLRRWRCERDRILSTLGLIQRRCAQAGQMRPVGISCARWHADGAIGIPSGVTHLFQRLCALADWAAYAPRDHVMPPGDPPAEICRRIVREVTVDRLRKRAKNSSPCNGERTT